MYNYLQDKYNIDRLKLGTAIYFFLFIILIMGGILAELGFIKNTPSWAPNLFMLVGSLLILFYSTKKLRFIYLAIGIIGFLYEVIGVKFGFLFGAYSYSEVFNLQLFSKINSLQFSSTISIFDVLLIEIDEFRIIFSLMPPWEELICNDIDKLPVEE